MISKKEIFLIIVCVMVILLMPWLFTHSWLYDWTDCESFVFTSTGEIGDTVGGITAPFVGMLSALLTYLLLRHQLKRENQETEEYIKDGYERRLFELLNQHNRIVDRIGMENFSEFYVAHQTLCQKFNQQYIGGDRQKLSDCVFYCMYYGINNKDNIFRIISKIGDEALQKFLAHAIGIETKNFQDPMQYVHAFNSYIAENTNKNRLTYNERSLLGKGQESNFSGYFEITTYILLYIKGHDDYSALVKAYFSDMELKVLLTCSKYNEDKTFVKLINSWQ